MKKNVKITTSFSYSQVFSQLFDAIFPCKCVGCSKIGEPLCECCKKYIMAGIKNVGRFKKDSGVIFGGFKEGLLEKMIKEYKYQANRAMSKPLAEIFAEIIEEKIGEKIEKENVIVVPLPTISRHIRERGYDHIVLIAKEVARIMNVEMREILRRENSTVQVGASAEKRKKQAAEAYKVVQEIDAGKTYLLIDDVTTTGASLEAAEKVMRDAGAEKIYKAAIVRNSIMEDDSP